MKILVISLAGIGDTLMATPLIHELRVHFPDATIDALVRWGGARDLIEANPHVNTVHHDKLIAAGRLAAVRFFWQLRRQRYDLSLNTYPQSKIHYRVGAFLAHAPRRLSHAYENFTFLDRWLVNRTIPQDYGRHAIENNLKLLDLLDLKPALPAHDSEIFLRPEECRWAEEYVRKHQLADKKILGIHVGSGKTKNLALRRWPLDCYLELIQRLVAAVPHAAVLLFGGPEEESDHERILAQTADPRVQVGSGKNLRQTTALLQKCHAFLSVDTVLMHLAAAVKVPQQFVIETPTFNKTIEPYQRPYVLIENPAVHGRTLDFYRYDGRGIQGTAAELAAAMRAVKVEAVLSAVQKALAG